MDWSIIATIFGTIFSAETIRIFLNRKTSKRVAESEAKTSEFNVLKETIEFLQVQLNDKEKRFAEQTALVRKLNAENLELAQENTKLAKRIGELEVELERKRCDDLSCPFRLPPNAFTPAPSELTKEEYCKKRNDNESD